MPPHFPPQVCIVEVGPRDGLQNESRPIHTPEKIEFIGALAAAGVRHIEATSFVQPERVPQLADADAVMRQLPKVPGVTYSALTPNEKGLERALAAGVQRIAVFTAASETFNQHNINMSIGHSLEVFAPVIRRARAAGLTVRGYISTCFICPFEGDVPKERVRDVAQQLFKLGVDEVALSDTIGAASPRDIYATVGHVAEACGVERLALHLHNTYGTGLANVLAGLELGVTTFDAAAGGLGGCPFAPGAAGNLATEDLVYMLERMGIDTGVSYQKVVEAARRIFDLLARDTISHQSRRLTSIRPPRTEEEVGY